MLPSYNLTVDITARDKAISEKQFRMRVEPCLSHLSALQGSFSRVPCTTKYYQPGDAHGKCEHLSVRAVVMVSVGQKRGEYILQLYAAISRLIILELDDFDVESEVSKFEFSY